MTLAPEVRPLVFDNLADAVAALRSSGLRLSTPRRLLLGALFAAHAPMSAADLARDLSLEESSVYRNVEVLEQHGLVRHMHLGHSPGLYLLVGRGETEYLYCERCGRVTAVSTDAIDPIRDEIRRSFGYTARFTHFPIIGICEHCASC